MVIESRVALLAVPPGAFGEAGDDIPIGMEVTHVIEHNDSLTEVVDVTVPLNVVMPFPEPVILEFPNQHNLTAQNMSSLCLAFHNGLLFECASDVHLDADTQVLSGRTEHFTAFTIMERDKAQHVDVRNPVPARLRQRYSGMSAAATTTTGQGRAGWQVGLAIGMAMFLLA